MKKIFLNKLFLISSTSLLFVYGIIYACADVDFGYFGYDSNFTPETFADKSYTPLFLSGDVFYGIGTDTEHNSRFNNDIKSDWNEYLKGKIDTKDIGYFLIGEGIEREYSEKKKKAINEVEVEQIHIFYKTKKSNPISVKWGKKINLNDGKIKSFLEFLYIAQKIETVSVNTDFWSYDPVVAKTIKDSKLIQSIENVYNTTSDPFLKNRYWFQTMKAHFYSNNKQKTIAFFNKTENSIAKTELYYRALAYVAGIHYKSKQYAVSNYLYALVFDKCPEMRVVTAYCFHPQNEKDWNKSLAMAKNNEEKAGLWAIHGYYKDEIKAIEKIYELDSKSEHLNYLLTRLVNKQEQNVNDSFFIKSEENSPGKNQTIAQNRAGNKTAINKVAFDLVKRIAIDGKTNKLYVWDIALGYLQTLNGDYDNADANFNKTEKIMPKTDLAKDQLRLLRFVNNLSKIDKLSPKNEQTILADLNWLYHELPQKYDRYKANDYTEVVFRYQNASEWSKAYLAALYREQSNMVMVELFENSNGNYWENGNDFYDNQKNLVAMKEFLTKKNKTEIENIAADIYAYKLTDIYEFQAIQLTFKNKIPEAVAYLRQTDTIQNTVFYGNPFNGNIKDNHDFEYESYQKKKYTFIDFLTTIMTMQNNVEKNNDVYTNSLLLGNAFYNITHFGNARIFHEMSITGYGTGPYSFRDQIKDMITNCDLPKMYYQKAFEVATTKEQKAKCVYLISKCERNQYYNDKYKKANSWWEIQDDKINFIAWNGFKTLKKDYSDTKYYQDVIAECGYFNTYINQ